MGKKVIVFGSFVVDLTAWAKNFPMPGETIMGNCFKMGPGGKGSNQAVAAYRAGADVILATKVGKDVFGTLAEEFYQNEGMDTRFVWKTEEKETGTALIMVDEHTGENMILVTTGANSQINANDVNELEEEMKMASYLLVQLETNEDALKWVIDLANKYGVKVILNPAPAHTLSDEILNSLELITPNETEAYLLTGIKVENYEDARRASRVFLEKGVKNVVITLGGKGVYINDGKRDELLDAIPVAVVDTTGAGDAFNGGLVCALAEGKDLYEAVRYGNTVGALCVSKKGTAPAMPKKSEIEELYKKTYCKSKGGQE